MAVLIAVDFSDASRRAVDLGVDLARRLGERAVLVHAVTPPPRVPLEGASLGAGTPRREDAEAAAAKDQAQRLRALATALDVDAVLRDGEPDDVILAVAKDVEPVLLVVGSHGWRGVKRFVLGSVAQALLHRSRWPVVVVPAA